MLAEESAADERRVTKRDDALPEIFTVADVAKIFHCSEPTIREMIRSGKLRAFRVGRTIKMSREHIEALVAGR